MNALKERHSLNVLIYLVNGELNVLDAHTLFTGSRGLTASSMPAWLKRNNVATAEANSACEYLKEFCEQTSTDLNGKSLNVNHIGHKFKKTLN